MNTDEIEKKWCAAPLLIRVHLCLSVAFLFLASGDRLIQIEDRAAHHCPGGEARRV
jgi:hypothetical protein